MYDGKVKPGHKIVMVGGGLVGCEAGLFLQKTGHEVTVVELLGRLANESFGMYREALIWEMEKCGMAMLPKTRCLEITPTGVKVENAGGVRPWRPTPSSLPLGMKSVDIAPLKAAAEAARTQDLGHRRRHPARQGGSGHPQRLSGRHRGGPLSPPPRNKSTPPAKPEGFCLSEKRQEPLFRGRCAQDEP